MAGTLGLNAAILSFIPLQMLLCATLPELSKTLDALVIAVPSLTEWRQFSLRKLFEHRASPKMQAAFLRQGHVLGQTILYFHVASRI